MDDGLHCSRGFAENSSLSSHFLSSRNAICEPLHATRNPKVPLPDGVRVIEDCKFAAAAVKY